MLRLAGGLIFVFAVLATLGWMFMVRTGPGSAEPPTPREERPREAFAADRACDFEAARAMKYLREVCDIGPRISGTEGMKKQQELLRKHFEGLGAKVELQTFTARQKSRKEPVEMANLVVSWNPDRPRRALLCSHYDTRPIADQEPDRRDWHRPFLSANDGGSGVALLMELGHHLATLKPEVGVDFVFFDGEEYIYEPGEDGDQYFFGSKHFANQYRQGRLKQRYGAAVLLDMVAGKDARFPIEQYSWAQAGPLVQALWSIAAEQRSTVFLNQMGEAVRDDHLALNQAGIPAVDVIDFSYRHWHRLSDVPDNCSGESMYQVARVLMTWLQRIR